MFRLLRVTLTGSLFLLGFVLVACGSQEPSPTVTVQIYQPPTQDPAILQLQETETARLTIESLPSPTPVCSSDLRFVEDVTIEDGTVVSPGERLDKRWKVENSGSCNWDADYEVRLIAGPPMGVPTPQALFPALSGTEAVIRMLFKAPDEAGFYRSAWQAFGPDGDAFGDTFFIDIVVANE